MPATLLLADDSVTIQRVIEMTFAGEDVRVVTVGDGREAIERIAADPPDIVLADTNMPEKDGYEVSAFVKAESARSGIPVVLLTGAFEPVDDARAREVGCDAVLVKPFEPTAVLNRVRELLGLPADAETEASAPTADAAAADGGSGDEEPVAADGGSGDAAEEPVAAPAAADGGSGNPTAEPVAAPAAAAPDASPADPDSAAPAAADASPADPDATAPAADASPADADSAAPAADASPAVPAPEPPAAHDEEPGDAPAEGAGDAAPPVPAVPAVEAPAPPSLAAAFAALLAAEQGDLDRARAAYPWPRQATPPDEDDLVERVAERVVERLSNDVTGELVSEVVARVAERLVRDQIGRIEPA